MYGIPTTSSAFFPILVATPPYWPASLLCSSATTNPSYMTKACSRSSSSSTREISHHRRISMARRATMTTRWSNASIIEEFSDSATLATDSLSSSTAVCAAKSACCVPGPTTESNGSTTRSSRRQGMSWDAKKTSRTWSTTCASSNSCRRCFWRKGSVISSSTSCAI